MGHVASVNVVNYYLDPEKPTNVQTLVSKSASLNLKDEATLQGFVLEALRMFCVPCDPSMTLIVD